MRRHAALASLAASVVACGPPHVELDVPPRSAPPQARVEAYEELRPRSPLESQGGPPGGIPSSVLRTADRLQLASGAQVYHAEDLRPALPPGSAAAREAERADSRASNADLLTAAGIVLLTIGASVAVAPFLVTDSEDESINVRPIYIGTGLAVLSIPAFLIAGEQRRSAKEAKANTFELYEPALRRRLDVCLRSDAVEPCPKKQAPSGAQAP